MTARTLPLLLIGLVVALMWTLGIRLPVSNTAAALLACVVAGLIWRARSAVQHDD